MTETKHSGQCLCGAVRFQAKPLAPEIGICHCDMCRRWTGGLPFAGIDAEVALQASNALTWWTSSSWAERGFCSECGTPLFWRSQDDPGDWAVNTGALESAEGLTIKRHIFIDEKPDFYDLADDAPRLTGPQFMAELFSNMTKAYGPEFLTEALQQLETHSGAKAAADVRQILADKGLP